MKNDDVALIRRILTGDEIAFAELVKKYQKQVHVLAWRKIGDFHIAEDITQDVFLKVYQRLHTLKDPKQFSGWLYVITTNLCSTWLRKNRIQTQPLEDAETTMIQRDAYSQHVVEERKNTAVETQREVVKRLLAKLKESERTVMTLHYLGEMTCEEISKFLGVSAGTIKSRLQRARNRLQKEETMIREALDHFQISPNLTDNIMREVARLKPATSTGGKPLVPWVIAASSAILIVLMLGISSQYLVRFQKPYSLDAQAEMTVELVDAPIVLNIEAKPNIQNRLGSSNALSESVNHGEKPDEVIFAAAQAEGEDVSVSKQEWIQSAPFAGSHAGSLFSTPEGDLYTYTFLNIYKLPADGETWQYITNIRDMNASVYPFDAPIAKWKNTLYFMCAAELFASTDDGKTWHLLHLLDKGTYRNPIELILTKQAFYMAFSNGVFRSVDNGRTWEKISDERLGMIDALVGIQNTLFAQTNNGLYRHSDDGWKRLEFPVSAGPVYSIAATNENLYVAVELSGDLFDSGKAYNELQRTWWIFRSTDLGDSWTDITPTNAWPVKGWPPVFNLIATGETLLVIGKGMVRSTDSGNTWMPPQLPHTSPLMYLFDPAEAVNDSTFYVCGSHGLTRSIDGGKSWDIVNIGNEGRIDKLIAFKETDSEQNRFPTLYGRSGNSIVTTTDGGKSWNIVQVEIPMTAPDREDPPSITQIVNSGGITYAKRGEDHAYGDLILYRVSLDDSKLEPIQGMPFFESWRLKSQLVHNYPIEKVQESYSGAAQLFKQLVKEDKQQQDRLIQLGFNGGPFAVSGNTFYLEYNFKLFRWEPGYTEWYDTGQEETVELTIDIARKDLKLAVSGNTVYVGKRDGHLIVSFDKGNNWIDLTPALLFPVKVFKEIIVAGSTVYVATDAGIITSDDGRNWRTVTDADGTNLIMEHLAVDGTTLYGITKDTGIYHLASGTWEHVVSEVPDNITSLAVAGNTLYVGTERNGMLHFNLEK